MPKTCIGIALACLLLTGMGLAQNEAWVARYNGPPGNGSDKATAIAVDATGNVYVTGMVMLSSTDFDYATVKYNTAGEQQWFVRYDGPVNGKDSARAIAVDGSGNVYVTGNSSGDATGYDYATIKYNSDGVQQWVARYDGPVNSSDVPFAIAVDGSGNVYVTGQSKGLGTVDYEYATVKYGPNGGEPLWVARYAGPGNLTDIGRAIAVDGSGNVYVTGPSPGSGTGDDYATIKYKPDGDTAWLRRYCGPGNGQDVANAIALDGAGNVYVTGFSKGLSTGSYDYATIKYNSDGVQQKVMRYDGPVNGADQAYAIAVDAASNVYVTGNSAGSGTGTYDYATVKYDPAGDTVWTVRYNGPGNGGDYAKSIAMDGSGNVYVTGYSTGDGTGDDYATIKYNPAGAEQWVRRYDGPVNGSDQAKAMAVDADGNVYATGFSTGDGTGADFATIKYTLLPGWFDLLTPAKGATNVAVAGDLTWEASEGAVNYDVHLGTTSPPPLHQANVGNVTTYPYSGLANSTPYYWAVVAKNVHGNTRCKTDFHFETIVAAPDAPTLVLPANNATNQPVNGTLVWNAAARATGYDVYLDVVSPPVNLVSENQPGLTYNYFGLTPTQTYYWQIVARNVGGTGSSAVRNFSTILAAPAVQVTSPNGGEVWGAGSAQTIICTHSGGAAAADSVLLSTDGGATWLFQFKALAANSHPWTVPDYPTTQARINVVVINVVGTAEDESDADFTIQTAPEAPVLVSPENGAKDQPSNGTLAWNEALRATGYDVYLDVVSPPVNLVSGNQPELAYDYSGLANTQTYYWKVVARGIGGSTPSEEWNFATITAGWLKVRSMPEASSGKPVKDGGWLTVGPGDVLFAAKGNKAGDFYSYDAVLDTWQARESIPAGEAGKNKPPSKGCIGVSDGANFVYMTKGNNTLGFWRYDIDADTWELLPGVPEGLNRKRVKGGTDMVYAVYKDTGCVFLLKGYKTEFYRYNTEAERWDTLPNAPSGGGKAKYDKGSFLAYDPAGYVYAHQAKYNDGTNHYMFRFDVLTGLWADTLKGMPVFGLEGGREKKKKSKDGAAGAWYNGSIYALKGGNTEQYWKHTPGADTAWTQLAAMPLFGDTTEKKKRVKAGADLVSYGYGAFFALKGNKTLDLWRFVEPASGLPLTANGRSGVMAGNVEVRTSKFELLPNPIASGFATLRFGLPKAGPVAVTVFDVAGRSVFRQSTIGNRQSTMSLDLRKVPAGVYLVRLDAEGTTQTQKLVVQK